MGSGPLQRFLTFYRQQHATRYSAHVLERSNQPCLVAAGTYVCAHAYTPRAIERAVRCGVRSIEHGNYIDPPTAQAMAEKVSVNPLSHGAPGTLQIINST